MKIAYIMDGFPRLSETFILNQITGMIDRGHDVRIFAGKRENASIVHPAVVHYRLLDRVTYFDIPDNNLVRALTALWRILLRGWRAPLKVLKSFDFIAYGRDALNLRILYWLLPFAGSDFDILHAHFGPNGNMAAYLKMLRIKGKLITSFHGYDIRLGQEKGGGYYAPLFGMGDWFLANSPYTREQLLALGADPSNVSVHYPGTDVASFVTERPDYRTSPPEKTVILTVARLVEEKGVEYALRACALMANEHPGPAFEYRICGDGPLRERLVSLADELDIGDRVTFLGPLDQDRVRKELRQAHLFCLPSLKETVGLAAVEAQASGMPVVATAVGSVPSVVLDGESGYIVPPKNPAALADRLAYLISRPDIWSSFGERGRKKAALHHDIFTLNEQLETVYEGVLKGDYSPPG